MTCQCEYTFIREQGGEQPVLAHIYYNPPKKKDDLLIILVLDVWDNRPGVTNGDRLVLNQKETDELKDHFEAFIYPKLKRSKKQND